MRRRGISPPSGSPLAHSAASPAAPAATRSPRRTSARSCGWRWTPRTRFGDSGSSAVKTKFELVTNPRPPKRLRANCHPNPSSRLTIELPNLVQSARSGSFPLFVRTRYSLESGSAMRSSERISASMPNPASATAAASISDAANMYPPASAQGEPVSIRWPNSAGATVPPIAVPTAATLFPSKGARPHPFSFSSGYTLWPFHMERSHEWSGQGSFGRCCEPIFVTSDQVAAAKKAGKRECKHDGRQRVVNLEQRFTEDETAKTECRSPDDAASGVGHQKCAPRHAIQSGEECRQYAQQRNEAAEEHNLGAMPHEQVLSELDTGFKHADALAVSQQKCVAVF